MGLTRTIQASQAQLERFEIKKVFSACAAHLIPPYIHDSSPSSEVFQFTGEPSRFFLIKRIK